jgi:hypothetical protein
MEFGAGTPGSARFVLQQEGQLQVSYLEDLQLEDGQRLSPDEG